MSNVNDHIAEILILVFFIITYFFSAFEKLTDWKGTVAYYSIHFKNTVFHPTINLLLKIVIILEIVTFFLLVVGIYFLAVNGSLIIAKISLEISAIILLSFLIGQRLAKDYQGAMTITVYFILNSIGLYLLT